MLTTDTEYARREELAEKFPFLKKEQHLILWLALDVSWSEAELLQSHEANIKNPTRMVSGQRICGTFWQYFLHMELARRGVSCGCEGGV